MLMESLDLRRLVAIIAEEAGAALGRSPKLPQCVCHGVRGDRCPERLRGLSGAGASPAGLQAREEADDRSNCRSVGLRL
jgi:hypothetical protein